MLLWCNSSLCVSRDTQRSVFLAILLLHQHVRMQLFVRAQELHTFEVCGDETVAQVKALVASREGLVCDDLAVYCGGHPLENEMSLASCTSDLSTLEVEVRMLGGKVHGSLARAGKVKGQTPKVDKEEKKKKRTGRAKRRMQYNRRFVNVVTTFGRRKGPNSNS